MQPLSPRMEPPSLPSSPSDSSKITARTLYARSSGP